MAYLYSEKPAGINGASVTSVCGAQWAERAMSSAASTRLDHITNTTPAQAEEEGAGVSSRAGLWKRLGARRGPWRTWPRRRPGWRSPTAAATWAIGGAAGDLVHRLGQAQLAQRQAPKLVPSSDWNRRARVRALAPTCSAIRSGRGPSAGVVHGSASQSALRRAGRGAADPARGGACASPPGASCIIRRWRASLTFGQGFAEAAQKRGIHPPRCRRRGAGAAAEGDVEVRSSTAPSTVRSWSISGGITPPG